MTPSPDRRPGEAELIDRYFRPLAGRGALDLRDDVALLTPEPGIALAVTTDSIVEGLDFFSDDAPEAIAAKALRVNLSDLASKGAEPFAFLLSLNLSDRWTETWVARFAAGLARDQGRYGADLIGGDMGRGAERTSITITAFGKVPVGKLVERDGAMDGDLVFVTGTIGDSALGLRLRKGSVAAPSGFDDSHLLRRYLLPEPRTNFFAVIRAFATSAMDVSDGLVGDLAKLCETSAVSAEVKIADVPLSDSAKALVALDSALYEVIVTGGEDYEILFTAPARSAVEIAAAALAAGVQCTAIGRVVAGDEPPAIIGLDGRPMAFASTGHDHFRTG